MEAEEIVIIVNLCSSYVSISMNWSAFQALSLLQREDFCAPTPLILYNSKLHWAQHQQKDLRCTMYYQKLLSICTSPYHQGQVVTFVSHINFYRFPTKESIEHNLEMNEVSSTCHALSVPWSGYSLPWILNSSLYQNYDFHLSPA